MFNLFSQCPEGSPCCISSSSLININLLSEVKQEVYLPNQKWTVREKTALLFPWEELTKSFVKLFPETQEELSSLAPEKKKKACSCFQDHMKGWAFNCMCGHCYHQTYRRRRSEERKRKNHHLPYYSSILDILSC